jgi:transcriptional regulator with XRE-family HTH domain
MTQISALLDKAKKARSIPSDNAFALDFGVKRQVVSQWRNGDTYPSEDHIARLAEMAGDDPVKWLVVIKAERTEGLAGKAWARLARQLGAAAAIALLASAVALPMPARALVTRYEAAKNVAEQTSAIYIMRNTG